MFKGTSAMFKDTNATEPPRTSAPAATAKPVTEDELHAILERLEAALDILRQNRELREGLSRCEIETLALQRRNAELEEIMREFPPMLSNVATTMRLAAKNEKPESLRKLSGTLAKGYGLGN